AEPAKLPESAPGRLLAGCELGVAPLRDPWRRLLADPLDRLEAGADRRQLAGPALRVNEARAPVGVRLPDVRQLHSHAVTLCLAIRVDRNDVGVSRCPAAVPRAVRYSFSFLVTVTAEKLKVRFIVILSVSIPVMSLQTDSFGPARRAALGLR